MPTLAELGFDTDNIQSPKWIGGETEALLRLDRHMERKAWVASFGKPKMTPQSLYASPAGLSPYLRFGCLSPRLFYRVLDDLYQKVNTFYLLTFANTSLSSSSICRSEKRHRQSQTSVKYCGESFSTQLPPKTLISIECLVTPYVFKSHGMTIRKRLQNGRVARLAFHGSTQS